MNQPWLKTVDWPVVTAINQQLCAARHAQHGITSDGHAPARALWEKHHREPLTLVALVELCRQCHKLAPFLNYNGNTFVAIARQVIGGLPLGARTAALRSLAGHIIAGTATPEEHQAFQDAVTRLSSKSSD